MFIPKRFRGVFSKIKRKRTEYSNHYDFHPKGLKVLHEFAEHLKKIRRRKFNKLFCNWESVRHLRKEDFPMVQRQPKWV